MVVLRMVSNHQGQAITEYILLLSVVILAFTLLSSSLNRIGFAGKIVAMLAGPFAASYQYGHPKALGPGKGGPVMHPRVISDGNFRIFFSTNVK